MLAGIRRVVVASALLTGLLWSVMIPVARTQDAAHPLITVVQRAYRYDDSGAPYTLWDFSSTAKECVQVCKPDPSKGGAIVQQVRRRDCAAGCGSPIANGS